MDGSNLVRSAGGPGGGAVVVNPWFLILLVHPAAQAIDRIRPPASMDVLGSS